MPDRNIIIRPNPFPGLRAFRPDEGHLFFGRMESTLKVVSRLKENRFVTVLGASGSGKSSLVMSGVIPALLKENTEEKKSWSYLVFRPALNPVDHLASELSSLSAGAGFNQLPEISVAASLHNKAEGLTDVVNRIRKNLRQQVVIVIDQFEEIFRFMPVTSGGLPNDDATDFIDLIVNAMQKPDHGLYIILTLRSEYVSECGRFHSLTNLMNSSSYLLPQIPVDQLAAVIEEPVKLTSGSIDRSLVKLILSDIEERPGQLPVLQHLMMRIWNEWSRMGDLSRPISISDYEAVGKLKGAISQHAGQAYESLDERHRYVCSRLFRTITTRSDDGRELRKPERIATIAAQTGCPEREIIGVAEVFRSPEYSFLTPSKEVPLNGESILDLTHESIIRLWGTLRKWMDEEEASVRLYRQLAGAAAQYQEGSGRLWTAPDLLLALRWRNENNPTLAWAERIDPAFERAMIFLKNSEEEYRIREEYGRKSGTETVRRSKLAASILGLLALLTLIAFGAVISLRNRAVRQKEIAVQMKDEAVALNKRLSDSLQILASALITTTGPEASGTIIPDERAKNEESGEILAENREPGASQSEESVKELSSEKSAALKKASEANRNRMISLAKSLAVRSLNYAGRTDLQVLLAWQAYLFNHMYSGTTEDADVFAALYDVCKRYGNKFFIRYTADGITYTAMAEGADGEFFTADTKGRVLSWNTRHPSEGYGLVWTGNKNISVMTVSPDNSWLACGTDDSEILMIPLDDDSIGYQLQDSSGSITSLVYSDNVHLFSSTAGSGVSEWDLATRRAKRIISDPSGITVIGLSDRNSMLAAITGEGKLVCWQNGKPLKYLPDPTGGRIRTALEFIPESDRLATGDNEGMIEIWDISAGKTQSGAAGHMAAINKIAFDMTDGQMITADVTGELRLWTMTDLKQTPVVFTDGGKDVLNLAFSDNGEAFLAATREEVIRRPAHIRSMTDRLCDKVSRNLTEQEWAAFVGRDIEYEPACPDKEYHIRVREIRGAR